MRIEIQSHYALNPSIIRVNVCSFEVNEAGEETTYRYFELAVPVEDFIEDDGNGNVGINEQLYQRVITDKIMAANKTANIAAFLDNRQLAWDVVIGDTQEETVAEENESKIKLAYGSGNVSQ